MIKPWRDRPADLNPPLVGLAPEAGTYADLGCCLSAAICLFLASLSGRPELVLPVSGTANLLILTSHYDGPTQPNGPRRGGNREAPDRDLGDRVPVRDAARAGGRLRDPPAQGRTERRTALRHPAPGHGRGLGRPDRGQGPRRPIGGHPPGRLSQGRRAGRPALDHGRPLRGVLPGRPPRAGHRPSQSQLTKGRRPDQARRVTEGPAGRLLGAGPAPPPDDQGVATPGRPPREP